MFTTPCIVIGIIISISVAIMYFFPQLFHGPTLRYVKNMCCFYLHFIIILIFLIFLLNSMISTLYISTKLSDAVKEGVTTIIDSKAQFLKEITTFESQILKAEKDIESTLMSVENAVMRFPLNVGKHINQKIRRKILEAENMRNYVMKETKFLQTLLNQNLKKKWDTTKLLLEKFFNNINFVELEVLQQNTTNLQVQQKALLHDLNMIKSYLSKFNDLHKFLNWTKATDTINDVNENLLPKLNYTTHFINLYPIVIKQNIKSEIYDIMKTIEYFKKSVDNIVIKLMDILSGINSNAEDSFKRIVDTATEKRFFYKYGSLRMLLPNLQANIYGTVMTFISLYIIRKLWRMVNEIHPSGSTFVYCTLFSVKITTACGLLLLGATVLISSFHYKETMSFSESCYPVTNTNFYSKYIDNKDFWGNQTWLDSVLKSWGHNYELQHILEKCGNNATVYQAFNIEKYWNLNQLFDEHKIPIDNDKLFVLIKNVVESIALPNGTIATYAKNNLSQIEKETSYFIPQVINNMSSIVNKKLLMATRTMLEKTTPPFKNITTKMSKSVNLLNIIKNKYFNLMLQDLLEFKFVSNNIKNDLEELKNKDLQISKIIQSNMENIIMTELTRTSEYIKNVMVIGEIELANAISYHFGNCHFLPHVLNKITETACDELPTLIILVWSLIPLSIMIMISSMMVCCSIRNYALTIQRQNFILYLMMQMQLHREMRLQENVEDD